MKCHPGKESQKSYSDAITRKDIFLLTQRLKNDYLSKGGKMDKLIVKMTKHQIEQLQPAFDLAKKAYEKNPKKPVAILMQPFEIGIFKVGVLPYFYANQIYKIIERANKSRIRKLK